MAGSACGCITITPNAPSFSWKSLTKPKIQQASYEEKVEDAPGDPKNPAKLKLAYGKLMEEVGNTAEARKNYIAASELQPKNVEALLGIARLDQMCGNIEQAEKQYKQALKLEPNSGLANFSIGQFYASQKRWEEATDALTKAMLSEPEQVEFRYALAVALVHRGDVDAALPHFIRTIGDAEAHYNVGLILQEEKRLEEAERHFALAVTKKPELTAAQSWLTRVREMRATQVASETGSQPSDVVPAGHHAAAPESPADQRTSAMAPSSSGPLSAQQIEQLRNQQPLAGS
jgi:tetratricopeptide (TPR) repeat protein